jgi:hypothetical protein
LEDLGRRASSLVWQIERPYVKWFFSDDSRVNSSVVRKSIQKDGFDAAVFWRASQFWFTLGSLFVVIGLPLTAIGLMASPIDYIAIVFGVVFFASGLLVASVGVGRRRRFRELSIEGPKAA